jgi:hypothetical protein
VAATLEELASRVLALESELARLKERIERLEIEAAIRVSEEQIARGEGIPVREALEMMRRKFSIPAPPPPASP